MQITPDIVIEAYKNGLFPMADARHATEIAWYEPERRALLPIEGFHTPKRLLRTVQSGLYGVTFDRSFETVIRACADQRRDTWINDEIINLYKGLHAQGVAHSVEAWDKEGLLVGGLYGLALGGAFFGESMFSVARDASKVALVHLVRRLADKKFTLLDAQFFNPHLVQFGLFEVSRMQYRRMLATALAEDVAF